MLFYYLESGYLKRKKRMNKELINFIKEARKRGFSDLQIKEHLIKNNYPQNLIEESFLELKPNLKYKNQITLWIDNEILAVIEKRAKKNMFTVSEQIEDILRRSCIRAKQQKKESKDIDDLLVSIFSRRNYKKKSAN